MKKKILVVEDNKKLLNSICALLEDDYQVFGEENGRDGISTTNLELPDLVISDIMMPEVNGYELVDELKKKDRTRHIPIILLTALGEDERKIEGYNYGADDYIVKPFKYDVLVSRIENLLKSRQDLREVFDTKSPINHEFGIKDTFLTHVDAILVNHYKFRDFSIPGIAELMNVTTSKLEREIKKLTGTTPIKYINDFRLNKAKHMLEQNDKSIFEISYTLGFKSVSYFGKAFKEKFGVAPSKVLQA